MKRLGSYLVGAVAWGWMALLAFPSSAIAQGPGSNLNQRVTDLEARMDAAEARLSDAETENANQAAQIAALEAEVVPVGTIIVYSAETPPAGYRECDGTQLSRAAYPELFAAIGTAFGAEDSSTFRLPDLRGSFLRGWDHGSGRDPDRTTRFPIYLGGATGDHVGSFQSAAFQSHSHAVFSKAAGSGPHYPVTGNFAVPDFGVVGSTNLNGGNETRPRNVSVMYAIKY